MLTTAALSRPATLGQGSIGRTVLPTLNQRHSLHCLRGTLRGRAGQISLGRGPPIFRRIDRAVAPCRWDCASGSATLARWEDTWPERGSRRQSRTVHTEASRKSSRRKADDPADKFLTRCSSCSRTATTMSEIVLLQTTGWPNGRRCGGQDPAGVPLELPVDLVAPHARERQKLVIVASSLSTARGRARHSRQIQDSAAKDLPLSAQTSSF
jgi:hypothetical protein